jgi:hypothetical protein
MKTHGRMQMRNEIPIIVHEYLRTIDNNELAANSELRELYNKSIELSQLEIGQHDEKELDGVESSNDNNTSMKTITEATGSLDANNNRNSIGVATQIPLEPQLWSMELSHESCDHRDHSKIGEFYARNKSSFARRDITVMERYVNIARHYLMKR